MKAAFILAVSQTFSGLYLLLSINIFKVSLLRSRTSAEHANRLLGGTDLWCDWLGFNPPPCTTTSTPSSLIYDRIVSAAPVHNSSDLSLPRPLTEAKGTALFFCFFLLLLFFSHSQEQYSASRSVPLSTWPTFTVNDVSLTPIVPRRHLCASTLLLTGSFCRNDTFPSQE